MKYVTEAFGAVPTEEQVNYQKEELTAFIHFGVNTFTGREWGDGGENPKIFNPRNLDADQWVKVLADAGFGRVILTAKHHDGFCLWNSKYTKHSVASSPWKNGKGDVVKEVSEACGKYNIKFGVYLSPWDQNSEHYGEGNGGDYNKFYMNQLRELLTSYGPIAELWMDGAKGSNVKQEYNFEEWFALIKELQAKCLIFSPQGPDIRWIGNEKGYAGETCWSTIDIEKMKERENPTYLNNGEEGGPHWVVGESDVSIRPGWFYHESQDNEVKSLEKMMDIYFKSIGRNSVLLLNIPPNKEGKLHENDVNRLKEFGETIKKIFKDDLALNKKVTVDSFANKDEKYGASKIVDGNYDTYWAPDKGSKTGTIEIDLGESKEFDVISLQEYIPLGQRVSSFNVEVLQGEIWNKVYEGKTIGYKRLIRMAPIKGEKIRINITASLEVPLINNVGVYKQPNNIDLYYALDNSGKDMVEFEKIKYEVSKNIGAATFKVIRKGGINGKLEVNYDTLAGTALNGVDYQTWSGTLAFNEGEREKTFHINIINNKKKEEPKEFYLKLSDPIGGVLGVNSIATVIINSLDDFDKLSRFNEWENTALNENIERCKLALWYDESATHWENEALPIGNGYMGGMIFGSVESERIQYNEKTLWSGGPGAWKDYNGGNKEGAWEAVKEIRRILAYGKTPSNDLYQRVCGDQRAFGAYQNFGDIFLDFKYHKESEVTNYGRELNIEESLSTVKYSYKGVNYEREYFCSYPDNVLVIKLKADKASSLNVDIRNEGAHNGKNLSVENNTLILSGALEDNGMKYESQVKVINTGGSIKGKEDRISVENADEITIIMSAGTDYINEYPTYKGEDPHSAVTERINNAVNLGYDELKSRHIEDYKNLFNRVNLNLGELKLDKPTDEMLNEYKRNQSNSLETLFFQYGRYLLISSSREGSLPANLQGVWNDSNNPPWSSDYHFNVNIEMNYWPAEVTNLSETVIPLVKYVESLREPGRKTAEMHCGIEGAMENKNGWTVNTMNNPFGFTAMGWEFDWGWAPTSNAWISQNLWEHYKFTEDKEDLRENIYPIMKEAAQFWMEFLVEYTHSDGKTYLVSSPSYSPEHGPRTVGATFDQELIWQLFTDTIKASEILGIDEEFRAELENKRERFLKPQIGKYGQVKEWKDDIDEPNNNHRHISHIVGLYPGNQINKKDTKELYEAAKVTINHRGDGGTGWSKANKINLWARLLDGDRAHRLLENQLKTSTLENLFDTHPPFQIDGNMGAVSGIAEMLLQSHLGTINPLPALPRVWKEGSFHGLKARGNFEVSAKWNNNSLNHLKIKSGSGNDCYLEYKGITKAIITDAKGYKITKEVISENVVKFKTEIGGEYEINIASSELLK